MSVIQTRLKRSFNFFLDARQPKETIKSHINSLSVDRRRELISYHTQLNLEYNVLCSKIACDLEANADIFILRKQMRDVLNISELLEVIYLDYLDTPKEKDRLKREQQALLQWLYLDPNEHAAPEKITYLEDWIRENTSYFNLPRVCLVRFRKLILALAPFIDSESLYNQTILPIDHFIAVFLTNLACFYFLPRLLDNLAMIVKHTIKHETMTQEERALGWHTRLHIQLCLRWVELTNDLLWLIDNIISMFILVGSLLPIKIAYSMCMQLVDVTIACIQKNIEIDALYQQRNEYIKCRDDASCDSDEYEQIVGFIEHFDRKIHYENNMLWIPIINSCLLVVALILAIPTLAPACSVASGVIAISVTLGSHYVKKQLEEQKPTGTLFELLENTQSNHGFFSRSNSSESNQDTLQIIPNAILAS